MEKSKVYFTKEITQEAMIKLIDKIMIDYSKK